jgi:hypothetical protein
MRHAPLKRLLYTALCGLAMALLVAPILLWWGLMPLTAVLIAIFISCFVAALYAWWLARRALRPLDAVGRKPEGRDAAETQHAAGGIHSEDQP